MSNQEKDTGYIVPHTHWDREWRYPLWKNRSLLVEFMDQLLDILDNDPEYRCFVMDGQSVVIEDYLEIKPEKKEKVCKYIQEGKIAIGPWYTLPDLYPVAGECLVRNLLHGIRVSKKYGGYLQVAYNSFGWGQTAQFPQIYKEFGFDFIIAAKNVAKERALDSEFMWEAPDGTRVLTTRLGEHARANFYMNAYIPIKFGVKYLSDGYRYNWGENGIVYHRANVENCHEDYFKIDGEDSYYPEMLSEALTEAWQATDETVVKNCRLLMDGSDFSTPQPDLTKIIRDANNTFEDREFKHGTLAEYAAGLKQSIDYDQLELVKGELRDGPASSCSANALATRIYIKQLNKKAQNMLIYQTEPVVSLLAMMGREYPAKYLEIAWEYLLKSHAHDSINGVTQDKTVHDTVHRLNQVTEISKVLYEDALADLIKWIDLTGYNEDEVISLAVNPSPAPVRDVVKLCVDLPREQNVWDFKIEDCNGNQLPVQHISRQEDTRSVHDFKARPWPFKVDRHIFYLDTGEVPAGGYKTYKVIPERKFDREIVFWPQMRKSKGNNIARTGNILENEYLKVKVESNGTLNIKDKTTGRVFTNLHYFEDTGDVGDYWVYYPPYENETYTSLGCSARTWCQENGPLAASLGIEVKMEVPAYAHHSAKGVKGESKRSEVRKELIITSVITLKQGAKRLDITTEVDNTVEDHRLQVMFPTGIEASHSYAAGHFTVDKRPVIPTEGTTEEFYPEMQTKPQQRFIDISNGKLGLAIINNSLTEYELKNDEKRTLALTLFRSVRNRICTEFRSDANYPDQQGGQSLGRQKFAYAIYPHPGDWEKGKVYREAEKFNIPLTVLQTSPGSKGKLPEKLSLFSIKPDNLILSAFKKAEDRDTYILRVFNPTDNCLQGKINTETVIKEAYLNNLNEVRKSGLEINEDNVIEVDVASNKIVTVELKV